MEYRSTTEALRLATEPLWSVISFSGSPALKKTPKTEICASDLRLLGEDQSGDLAEQRKVVDQRGTHGDNQARHIRVSRPV